MKKKFVSALAALLLTTPAFATDERLAVPATGNTTLGGERHKIYRASMDGYGGGSVCRNSSGYWWHGTTLGKQRGFNNWGWCLVPP
jgi:hypothetical protein